MRTLHLKPYCNKTPDEFRMIMLKNARQNCVGMGNELNEDWGAYENGLIMEFEETNGGPAGTLREFSDVYKEKEFMIVFPECRMKVIRVSDVFITMELLCLE